jgi:hypothetical protein
MQLVPSSLALRASRLRAPFLMMAAALLLGVALAGCKTNPAALYQTGYDKQLTARNWAARAPDEAVVVIGGYPSVWQKADEKGFAFETRPRFPLGWGSGYDVALVKAGTYQMVTIVGMNGSFADFGGITGLGAASGPVIASFEVGPGQVVYVGNLNAPIQVDGATQCWVDLSVTNAAPHVTDSFAKEVPYVTVAPTNALMTIKQSFIRFPCGRGG